jgi:heme oxygenase
MGLVERIRAGVSATHERIERVPFSQALIAGRLGRDDYVEALSQLYHVHEALERELGAHPELEAVYRPESMARAGVLRGDLAALGAGGPHPCGGPAARLAGRFAEWSAAAPWSLLGALYIYEGSRMGSMMLHKPLARALGVESAPGRGLDYHLDGLAGRPAAWKRFRADLESLTLSPEDGDRLVAAAVETMDRTFDLYASLPVGRAEPEPAAP